MAMQEVPAALQRRQRWANFFGEPVHVPTVVVSICPACALPTICGGPMLTGRAAGGVPAGVTVALGVVVAVALRPADVAVVTTTSECPTSALTGFYGLARRPGDRDAVRAGRVTARPRVREAERLSTLPGAGHGCEQHARLRRPDDRRRNRQDRRARRIGVDG